MDAQIINPFVNATLNVLKTMTRLDPIPEKPFVKTSSLSTGCISGLIGLAGDRANGSMTISFDRESALAIVSALLMEKFETISDEVVDAIGEITNMICGGAKAELETLGYNFHLATPAVVVGENLEVKRLSRAPTIVIPFKLGNGSFVVESNLALSE